MSSSDASRDALKRLIEEGAFVRGEKEPILSRGKKQLKHTGWLFDIRRIAMRADVLEHIGTIFWDTFEEKSPFQVGGIESGAIPLVTALVLRAGTETKDSTASGFFIRKSRKKDGLLRMIEGEIKSDVPIILVDDLINSGKSFIRQVEVLEELGHKIHTVWTVVRFRDEDYYTYFHEKGIAVKSIFTLDDFAKTLDTHNLTRTKHEPKQQPYTNVWKFASPNPSYQYVVPKSDPVLDAERIYFGSDSGVFWALNQEDGSVAWSFKTGWHPKGKGIFSSPKMYEDMLFFGGYDGNVYGLDAKTGRKKWVSFEADWVGSSPALAPDLGLLFIGLEYGLFRKRGGIAALDMQTGETKWAYRDMPCFTHSSPLYIQKHTQVVIGSNDGAAYLFDARSGELVWKFETGQPTEEELISGFSSYDIKESFAYDEKRDLIIFGNKSGSLCFVERKSGKGLSRFRAEFGFYSTPLVYKDSVYTSSLDKNLYCINLDTFQEKWRWHSGARMFASPTIIGSSIYVGSNAGRLTELDPETGEERSFLTLPERITNRPVYNQDTKRFFVPTFANEIYCIIKKGQSMSQPL